jgi:hypothetical protein
MKRKSDADTDLSAKNSDTAKVSSAYRLNFFISKILFIIKLFISHKKHHTTHCVTLNHAMKRMYIILLLLALATNLFCQQNNFIGITGGFKNSNGFGLVYQRHFSQWVNLNMGAGIFFDGIRLSIGNRVYFLMDKFYNPVLESQFGYSTGTPKLNMKINGEDTEFKISPGFIINIGGGIRFIILKKIGLQYIIGYGISKKDYKIYRDYIMTNPIDNQKDYFDSITKSGIYFSAIGHLNF